MHIFSWVIESIIYVCMCAPHIFPHLLKFQTANKIQKFLRVRVEHTVPSMIFSVFFPWETQSKLNKQIVLKDWKCFARNAKALNSPN